MAGYYIVMILSWVLTIFIAYIVIRKATRTDDQISLLRELVSGQDKIIKALTVNNEKVVKQEQPDNLDVTTQKSDDEYLREARKKAGIS